MGLVYSSFYSKQRILSTDKQKYHTRLSSFIKYANHGKWNMPNYKFLLNNYDIENSIEIGSAAAAIVVTKVGCAPAMPNLNEILDFMKKNKINEGEK